MWKRNRNRTHNRGVQLAIERAGSSKALAARCGVTQPAIMGWLYVNLPAERAVQIEAATNVPREVLRPDIFNK